MPDPNQLPSHRRIRRLNLRQRKKLCVGEFQEFGFPLHITFRAGLDDAGYSAFFNVLSKATQDDIIGRTEQSL